MEILLEILSDIVIPLIVAIVTGLIGPLVVYFIKKYSGTLSMRTVGSASNAALIEFDTLEERIEDHLGGIRDTLDADRVWVAEIEPSLRNKIARMSIIFESVSIGVSSEKENFQNILTSFFKDTLMELDEGEMILYETADDVSNFEMLRMFEQKGNVSMFLFAMKTIDEVLVGILGVDFVRDEHELDDLEKEYLMRQASLLVGYIEIMLIYSRDQR